MSLSESWEGRLAETFVELADTLVDHFDVVDFLHLLAERCVQLLDVAEAGLMLADQAGTLQVMASSDERAHVLELFQLQNEEGPCFDCYRTGHTVASEDIEQALGRWPLFGPAALEAGFGAVHAIPLRVRREVIGALNLFRSEPGALHERDARTGQAMAATAAIGLLQERSIREAQVTAEQLQSALNTRIVIEQAKGVIAEQATVEVGQAFTWLRTYARSNNRLLRDVAHAVVAGDLTAQTFAATAPSDQRRGT